MEKNKGRGLGIGLGNIYRRVTMYYPNGSMEIHSVLGEGTTITIGFDEKKNGGTEDLCMDY